MSTVYLQTSEEINSIPPYFYSLLLIYGEKVEDFLSPLTAVWLHIISVDFLLCTKYRDQFSDVRQGHYHQAAKILTMEIRLLFKSLKTKKDVTSVPREVYPNGLKGLREKKSLLPTRLVRNTEL